MPVGLYWCNLNFRDKYFGYKDTDDLVYVGVLEVSGPDDAFQKFNRIDTPVPVLDDAEAPSMSVGDVLQIQTNPGHMDKGVWYAVVSVGFEEIDMPDIDHLKGYLVSGRKAGDWIQEAVNRINSEERGKP